MELTAPSVDVAQPRSRILAAVRLGVALSALAAYIGLLVVGIVAHEPWFDEAQAWLIARDASIPDLLSKYLRYEGHPPLWYLILAVPAKLGLPYKAINVISAAIAVIGVSLLLAQRTVPLVIRILLPFTYFVAYQYTIVSRSYVLLLPILVLVLDLYDRRREHLWRYVLLLVLLSQVSLHGMSLAGAFTVLYAVDAWPQRRSFSRREVQRHLAALGVLLLNVLATALVLRPAADLAISAKLNFQFSPIPLLGVGWTALTSSLAGPGILSTIVLLVLCVWFHRRRVLVLFLVLTGSLLPISSIYFNRWHEGVFFITFMFVVLLAFRRAAPEIRGAGDRLLNAAALALLVLLLVRHTSWTVLSYRYDLENPYSGSRSAAEYIAAHRLDATRLFGAGFSVLAVQPYFDRPLFANYRTDGGFTFWDWSTRAPFFYRPAAVLKRSDLRAWMREQLAREPDYFLVSRKFPSEEDYAQELFAAGNYSLIQSFPGAHFWKTHIGEGETFLLYARAR